MTVTFGPEPGWVGQFTRNQAHGAYLNGTRIVKRREEKGDGTPLGTSGTVLGSLRNEGSPILNPDGGIIWHVYWVEWDTMPNHAVAVSDWKIGVA